MNAETVNQATSTGRAKAESEQLDDLTKIYLRLITAAGRRAAAAFRQQTALVAATNPKWVPPGNNLVDADQLTADAKRKTAGPHEQILRTVTAADEIGISWDINHPTSQQLLASVASRLDTLNAALRLQVSETIQAGYDQGWSVDQTARAIVAKVDDVAPARAAMYARTDLIALSNGGSLMAAQIAGVGAKSWLTAGDERVRETHADADGQTVPIDQPFDVGGEQAMYPGDPDLSDEEALNCRCTLTYADSLAAAATPQEEPMRTIEISEDDYDALVAAASGSTSLPLSDQAAKWDAGAARKTLKSTQFAKAHFWRDPDGDPDEIGSYKLPFAEVIDGTLTAIWHGVTAGAARLSQTDIPAADKKAVQAKMGAYYRKAATQFKDDSITPPWAASVDADRLAAIRELAPALDALTDAEILGTHDLILAAMKKHGYRGDGGMCAICGEPATADCHYQAASDDAVNAAVTIIVSDDDDPDAVVDAPLSLNWEGVLTLEGIATSDGRYFMPGAWGNRDLPLTLLAQLATEEGHDGAQVCGTIENIWKVDRPDLGDGVVAVMGSGTFDPGDFGRDVARLVAAQTLRGVSVDYTVEERGIYDPATSSLIDETPDDSSELFIGNLQLAAVKATIGAATLCAVPAFAAASISVTPTAVLACGYEFSLVPALVASVAPLSPPAAWFEDPKLDRPTPLQITDDGRVFGHLALWSSCHQGFPGRCVPPPHSRSGYSLFHVGAIKTEEGETLAIGKITLKAPHADVALNSEAARAHYDNTGTVAAFVRAGEDQFGPWVAGALRSDAPEEIVRDLLANPLSGDWRAGEMIAAHAVPAPGFPVLRAAAFDESGEETETALIMTSPIPREAEAVDEPMPALAYLRPGARKVA